MVHRAVPPRSQRVAVLATVAALHGVLIAVFLQQRDDVPPTIAPTTIAIVALAAERPAAAEPPPPALPAKLADTFKPVVEFSLPVETESDAPAGATGECSTQAAVLDALLLDPVALDAIRQAPAEARSVADAIVVWNEGWNPIAIDIGAPLGRVRAAIEQSLASVAPACLDEPVAGPRLLPIPDAAGTRTTFIVFGSGVWTWRALLAPPSAAAGPSRPANTAQPLNAS